MRLRYSFSKISCEVANPAFLWNVIKETHGGTVEIEYGADHQAYWIPNHEDATA